jgi:pyridoxine 5-phosphate synthase
MRRLSVCLDALPALREAAGGAHIDLTAASSLAELCGVDALRLGLGEAQRPVDEVDVQTVRRCAHVLELRMPPTPSLLKISLDVRPDAVLLSDDFWEGTLAARPLDVRTPPSGLASVVRSLEEAGIGVAIVVAPSLEAVKVVHGLGVGAVEFYTGATVDLPPVERRPRLEELADAAKLAAKLRMDVSVGGGLDYRSISEVVRIVPSIERVSVGRAVVARALLVGLDRAVRDLYERIG